jgi:hypothetical protein
MLLPSAALASPASQLMASTISGSAVGEKQEQEGRGREEKGSDWCTKEERRRKSRKGGGEERRWRKERKRGEVEGRSGKGRESLHGLRQAGRAKGLERSTLEERTAVLHCMQRGEGAC